MWNLGCSIHGEPIHNTFNGFSQVCVQIVDILSWFSLTPFQNTITYIFCCCVLSRAFALFPSECPKSSLTSSTRTSSHLHSPTRTDVLLSPFGSYTQMLLGNEASDMLLQQGDSSCTASLRIASPNKKRVSPLRTGNTLSPTCRKELGLKSIIPPFPSLTGDANSELQ